MDPETGSTDVINAARIRVAGVGGLGLVAMALVVAWFVPRIGRTLAVGLVLGGIFALVLILGRRRTGAMPSSGLRPGANTILSIDDPLGPEGAVTDESRKLRTGTVRTLPSGSPRPA
jgi:hypothetical protein